MGKMGWEQIDLTNDNTFILEKKGENVGPRRRVALAGLKSKLIHVI
jgi:hypothetical protein